MGTSSILQAGRKAATRIAAAAATALGLGAFLTAPASAQVAIMQPGYAAVTGFSGSLAYEAPEGANPDDYRTIDWTGAALRVFNLNELGPWGTVSTVDKPLTITADQVGQVFGVAIDDAQRPNIYVAATSAYGVAIYKPDASGNYGRASTGGPGAQFAPGQFGPFEQGGGPGSIWKIDGTTGAVSLFANVETAQTSVAALGGLAYDPGSRQIFAVDRATGVVYRFGLDGALRGSYDHGTEGRVPAGLTPAPYSGAPPVTNQSPGFDTRNPFTWGFAPPARRVNALAVLDGRLYYSIAQGPQIWSVGISSSGAVHLTPRLEVDFPALADGVEVASIDFDRLGRMYLAERGATTGDYKLENLAHGGISRVLRFIRKPAGDPSPGRWLPDPAEFAVGLPPNYNNTNGGVALGYGYADDGRLNASACEVTVWTTGGRLLDPGDAAPGTFPTIDGLQGNDVGLIRPGNTPPLQSRFVDFDDKAGNADYRGHMGAIAIRSECGGSATPPPTVVCPPGSVFQNGQCVISYNCPQGTYYDPDARVCVYVGCPPGYILNGNQCVPPPLTCPPGTFFYNGQCAPLACPPGLVKAPNGACVCPPGNVYLNGQCVPPNACPPGMVTLFGAFCWCPLDEIFVNGKCEPKPCPPGEIKQNGQCVPKPCPPGQIKLPNGTCVPQLCPPGQIKLPNGLCIPGGLQPLCPPNEHIVNGKCEPICKPWEKLVNGQCEPFQILPIPPKCDPGEILVNGVCKPLQIQPIPPQPPKCDPGEVLINGNCVPLQILPQPQPIKCGPGEILVNGVCKPLQIQPLPQPPKCDPGQVLINGKCVPLQILPQPQPIKCGPGEILVNGVCKPLQIQPQPIKCQPGQVLVNGKCVPLQIQPQPQPLQPCPFGQVRVNGVCQPLQVQPQPIKCQPGQVLVNGKCVPLQIQPQPQPLQPCPFGQVRVNGVCQPLQVQPQPIKCPPGQVLQNGKCVPLQIQPLQPLQPLKPLQVQPIACPAGQKLVNGKCQPICGPNEQLVNGQCQPKPIQLLPGLQLQIQPRTLN